MTVAVSAADVKVDTDLPELPPAAHFPAMYQRAGIPQAAAGMKGSRGGASQDPVDNRVLVNDKQMRGLFLAGFGTALCGALFVGLTILAFNGIVGPGPDAPPDDWKGQRLARDAAYADRSADFPPAPSDDALNPAEAESVTRILCHARYQLSVRDVDAAQGSVELAAQYARTPEQKERVEQMQVLCSYVREFWSGVRQRLAAALQNGQQIDIDGSKFTVVEAASDEMVIRTNTGEVRYTRQQLPAHIAEGLANQWFSDEYERRAHVAAFLAAEPPPVGNLGEARRLWRQVGFSKNVKPLLALLGDEVFTRPIEENAWPPPP